jgi:hypothetical protein
VTERAYLLTRSCTTGWTDWLHGELWLLPTALVRRPLGLSATVANGRGPTVRTPLPEGDADEIAALPTVGGSRGGRVIPFADIATASLRRGGSTDRLAVNHHDGTSCKLLWLHRDPAAAVLAQVLAAWL